MKTGILFCLLLCGCSAERKPVLQTPPGFVPNGYCIPDGVNAKTGEPDFLICKTKDGITTTYKRQ